MADSSIYRNWFGAALVIGVAACVSLSSPRAGREPVPVVRGSYRNGRDQLVRIALATAADTGRIAAMQVSSLNAPVAPAETSVGEWKVSLTGGQIRFAPADGSSPGVAIGGPVRLIAQRDSLVRWNGKRYRGEILVSASDSGLLVVNVLPMDSYLRGVVPLEIGNRTAAEFAAVEAQAVAARTYAYKHLSTTRSFDMYSTVQDQVYGGADAEKPQSDSAVAATGDMVILYGGQPINTPYHSTCGGSTAGLSEVWYDQPDEPYLKPVSDKIPGTDKFYCDPSPRFSWNASYDAEGIRAVMEKYLATYAHSPKGGAGRILDIREHGRTPSGRVAALTVQTDSGSYDLRGNDIRFVLRDPKGTILNSTLFDLTTTRTGGEVSSVTINGRGYGHGIGMCQWGAIGRARAGQNFRMILETYYPGTTIGRIA